MKHEWLFNGGDLLYEKWNVAEQFVAAGDRRLFGIKDAEDFRAVDEDKFPFCRRQKARFVLLVGG